MHYFLIIWPHFTIIYVLEVIYVYCVCMYYYGFLAWDKLVGKFLSKLSANTKKLFFFFWCLRRELTININQNTTDQAYHKHVTNSLWMNAFIFCMNLDFSSAFYSWSILTFREFIPLAQNKGTKRILFRSTPKFSF